MSAAVRAFAAAVVRPLERWYERREAAERAAVHSKPRWLPGFALMLAGLAAVQAVVLVEPGPVSVAAVFVVSLMVNRSAFAGIERVRAFRRGWYEGRSAMVSTLQEAMTRDMTVAEWVTTEMRRDLANLQGGETREAGGCPRCGGRLARRRPGWCRQCGEETVRPVTGKLVRGDGSSEPVQFVATDTPGRFRALTLTGEQVRVDPGAGDALGVDALAPGQRVDVELAHDRAEE